jgi:hypothetical protein
MQPFGGAPEMQFLGNSDEILNVPGLERHIKSQIDAD